MGVIFFAYSVSNVISSLRRGEFPDNDIILGWSIPTVISILPSLWRGSRLTLADVLCFPTLLLKTVGAYVVSPLLYGYPTRNVTSASTYGAVHRLKGHVALDWLCSIPAEATIIRVHVTHGLKALLVLATAHSFITAVDSS